MICRLPRVHVAAAARSWSIHRHHLAHLVREREEGHIVGQDVVEGHGPRLQRHALGLPRAALRHLLEQALQRQHAGVMHAGPAGRGMTELSLQTRSGHPMFADAVGRCASAISHG
jgi:hypothetical protein